PGCHTGRLHRQSTVSSPGARHVRFSFNPATCANAFQDILINSPTALWRAHVKLYGPGFTADRQLTRRVRQGRLRSVTVELIGDDADPFNNLRRVRMRIS
ncbi:MAG: hypothetical protein ACRDNK_19025, partial [Solirubrobacteraceae bacterium]